MIQSSFERRTPDGRLLRGDVRMPDTPPPRSAVVLVHGFKGFKDWGFFPHLATRLAAHGHAAVTFNFTGSGVKALDEVTDLRAFAANTFTREMEELALVLDMTRSGEILPTKPRTVGLLGYSRGGGSAILHSARKGAVDALVTWASVASFDRWTEETRTEWREQGRVYVLDQRTGRQLPLDVTLLDDFEQNRKALDIRRHARDVTAPWLIVHGMDDLTVGADEARLLAREAVGTRLHLVEGAGHTFEVSHPMDASPPRVLEEATQATLRHFGRHLMGEL